MDIENLENMDKSEFLPLGTVKQEMMDTANGIAEETTATNAENSDMINATVNIGSAGDGDGAETNNPVCDSAEKQVE